MPSEPVWRLLISIQTDQRAKKSAENAHKTRTKNSGKEEEPRVRQRGRQKETWGATHKYSKTDAGKVRKSAQPYEKKKKAPLSAEEQALRAPGNERRR